MEKIKIIYPATFFKSYKDLNANYYRLLLAIYSYSDKDGNCNISNLELSYITGIKYEQVSGYIVKLVQMELITRIVYKKGDYHVRSLKLSKFNELKLQEQAYIIAPGRIKKLKDCELKLLLVLSGNCNMNNHCITFQQITEKCRSLGVFGIGNTRTIKVVLGNLWEKRFVEIYNKGEPVYKISKEFSIVAYKSLNDIMK